MVNYPVTIPRTSRLLAFGAEGTAPQPPLDAAVAHLPKRAPGYYVMPGDWPTEVTRDELTTEQVYDVLDLFDDVYEVAMRGLRDTGKPEAD
ncbi:hypothetical protein FHS29_001883 [Saccharothrix tamanrassetensis]|uniref:Uncharacterized protein n=1 Tax=Saccharothrix tamanrassetensis TaxID=1051531 RepID=A0A841C9V4_9PSEU|nr:hypothetical protein [Saccharothrix tamanrassetensis]MBB5955302.1 hypothetical protein [Saccharothrix tamanrassetensis]